VSLAHWAGTSQPHPIGSLTARAAARYAVIATH